MAHNDEELISALTQHFVNSGEKQRLLTLLKAKLTDASWPDMYYAHCRNAMQDRKDNFTFDELAESTSDYGKSSINESIKKEMLVQIKKFLVDTLANMPPSSSTSASASSSTD
ncbi:transcription factor e(y)2-domain-containing protein [Gongronella butleri]|nr:transcription factor e(y)2-domain-containing protein [Gongronella butleri]